MLTVLAIVCWIVGALCLAWAISGDVGPHRD